MLTDRVVGLDRESQARRTWAAATASRWLALRPSAQLAERMEGWAGLGDVLAHHCVTIDHGRIAAPLHGELPDLERFAGVAAGRT